MHESVSGKILGTLRWKLTNLSKNYFTLNVRGGATPSMLRSHGSMFGKILRALPSKISISEYKLLHVRH